MNEIVKLKLGITSCIGAIKQLNAEEETAIAPHKARITELEALITEQRTRIGQIKTAFELHRFPHETDKWRLDASLAITVSMLKVGDRIEKKSREYNTKKYEYEDVLLVREVIAINATAYDPTVPDSEYKVSCTLRNVRKDGMLGNDTSEETIDLKNTTWRRHKSTTPVTTATATTPQPEAAAEA